MNEASRCLTRDFASAGYVHAPGFLDPLQLDELRREVARFVEHVAPRMPAAQVYRDDPADPSSLKQLQQLGLHDPWFARLQGEGRLPGLAAALLGEPVEPRNLQYFDKPSGTSRPTPAHQDGAYFAIHPKRAVTLWLALDDVESEQGCMRYVRGSHRRGLRDHGPSGVLGFSRGIEAGVLRDGADEVAVPCRAGDLLAHHCLTIHRAEANLAPNLHRRALGLVYYGSTARIDGAREAAYQEALAARLEAEGRL